MPTTRTPEGYPSRCALCGATAAIDYSQTGGDAPCPDCGTLLAWSHQLVCQLRATVAETLGVSDEPALDRLALAGFVDSLEMDEVVMELEDIMEVEHQLAFRLTAEELQEVVTFGDLFRAIAARACEAS